MLRGGVAGREYITRCPFSLARLVKVTPTGQVIYRAEKAACQPFPDPRDPGLAKGTKRISNCCRRWTFSPSSRNTFRRPAPPPGPLLRLVLEQVAGHAAEGGGRWHGLCQPRRDRPPPPRCEQTWAMLIKRVYEVDPLACPGVRRADESISFIDRRKRR